MPLVKKKKNECMIFEDLDEIYIYIYFKKIMNEPWVNAPSLEDVFMNFEKILN